MLSHWENCIFSYILQFTLSNVKSMHTINDLGCISQPQMVYQIDIHNFNSTIFFDIRYILVALSKIFNISTNGPWALMSS